MNLTRRTFGKLTTAFLAVPSLFAIEGCAAQSYISIVISAVRSILTYIGGSIGQQISDALAAVQTAVAAWTTGTITQQVVEALQALQAVLDTVPLSSLVTTLISIAIGAIEAILGATGAAVVAAPAVLAPRAQVRRVHPVPTGSLKRPHQFGAAWNSAADASGLPASVKVAVPLI